MSPPAHHAPQTPERRTSSTTLVTAFRTLTSGRSKAPSTSPSPPTAILTPFKAFFSRDDVAPLSLGHAATDTNHPSPHDSASDITSCGGAVLGGPPALSQLLRKIDSARPLPERISAALKIGDILNEYHASDVLAIWSAASDLTTDESVEASRAGFTLLSSCVKHADLSSFERRTLFEAIHSSPSEDHLDLRFQALVDLSTGGRNVEPFESLLMPFITRLLQAFFTQVTQARRKEKKSKIDPAKEEAAFDKAFKYIVDVTKFNATLLKEDSFTLLLENIITICKKTTSESDITNSINVINAVITYTNIPPASLRPCLELLSDIYRQLGSLREQTWDALANIFRSHLGSRAVLELIDILHNATSSVSPSTNVIRGACNLLGKLLKLDGKYDLTRVPLSLFMLAIESALRTRDKKFEVDVLKLLNDCLLSDPLKQLLLEEANWTSLVDTIAYVVEDLNIGISTANGTYVVKADDEESIKSQREPDRTIATESFHSIISQLCKLLHEPSFIHKDTVVNLLLRLVRRINNDAAETLVTFCSEEHIIYPSHPDWFEVSRILVTGLLQDDSRPPALRVLVASVLKEVFSYAQFLSQKVSTDFAMLALRKMRLEKEPSVLEVLASFAVIIVDHADDDVFDSVLDLLRATVFERRPSVSSPLFQQLNATSANFLAGQVEPSLCRIVVKQVIRMFIGNVNKSTKKTVALFDLILQVAVTAACATDARICAVKLMFRLRAAADYAIYVRPQSESESIAAVLCRTEETLILPQIHDEASSPRESRNSTAGIAQIGSSKQRQFNVKTPVPPLWLYPGPKALPEEPPPIPSRYLYSFIDPEYEAPSEGRVALKITHWLETVISLIQQPDVDWEVYSYILVHLGAQLANQNLFRGAAPQIKFLRSVLCDQIRASSFFEPPSHTSLKKADVAVCVFHILTMLVSYNDLFARSEQDEMVRSFILGLGSWDRTSKWCIHALSICCHELPESIGKSLSSIVQKMSQIITQPQVAIHILEFLAVVARMPELFKNFREDEYKMVFGVSFRYLQYVRDQRDKAMSQAAARTARATMRHSDSFRELRAASEHDLTPKNISPSDDLPQYVYALAYHVITFWFMALKLEDRHLHIPQIKRNLTYIDSDGNEVIEDQGLVTMDMMDKVAYSDRDETAHNPNFAKSTDGQVSQKTWIVGYCLMTIETAGRSGLSQITRRRPSGTKYFLYQPALTNPPRHQVPITSGLAADAFYTSSYIGILPEDVLQEFYSSISLAAPSTSPIERPIELPEDDTVTRALSVFDRNSTVDGHKIGVIYIGPGQSTETEILANTVGSTGYIAFISELGTLTRLKGSTFNMQGLDREFDSDGEYTYCWRDRATEIIFHIPTMMPTNFEADPACTNKKRHIGNDFVNIVWNESGTPFNFHTFPSQFNYVYIVITPSSPSPHPSSSPSFLPPHTTKQTYYKIAVLSAPAFPEISPASEPKVVSASSLPSFVRLLALNASVFSLVWSSREGGEHFSPWRNRLREIKRLRDKYAPAKTSSGGGVLGATTRDRALGLGQQQRSSIAATLASFSDRSSITGSSVGAEND